MGKRYTEALAIWQSLGDEAELANAYYNASFTFAFGPDTDPGINTDPDPEKIGLSYLEKRARHLPPDRRCAGRGQRPVGHRQLPLLPGLPGQRGRGVPRDADDVPEPSAT